MQINETVQTIVRSQDGPYVATKEKKTHQNNYDWISESTLSNGCSIFFFSVNTVVEHFGFLILPDVSVNKNGHVSPLDMETPGNTQTARVT